MDAKRRVTIPDTVDIKAGSNVVVIASTDTAIIASDTEVAENLAKLLQEIGTKKKQKTLSEWERLISSAGLSDVSSDEIDRAVARKIRRNEELDAREVSRSR